MLASVYPLRVRGRRLKIEAARRQVPAKGDLRTYQDRCHLVAVLEPAMPKDERALPPLFDPKLVLISPAGCKPAVDTLDGLRENRGG
ncbi:hypothetical protein [Acidithiobacillus sp.]|uniref:hypothetical protein n=1 Tax=Acidithiobacillus sp. TaxID=1872118 RepID=UPI001CDCB6C0|nr:hypothetical protein [Acidithiobacillus sp.]MDA8246901.1 hypothetical protein [Acidithiobacillus sp.]MDA8378900.1 hypothetical protein [Planctomycetia bacterium]UBU63681.1 hypothetical protein LDB30_06715 [Acidithiobacillus ferrooxidans]